MHQKKERVDIYTIDADAKDAEQKSAFPLTDLSSECPSRVVVPRSSMGILPFLEELKSIKSGPK